MSSVESTGLFSSKQIEHQVRGLVDPVKPVTGLTGLTAVFQSPLQPVLNGPSGYILRFNDTDTLKSIKARGCVMLFAVFVGTALDDHWDGSIQNLEGG